MENCRCKDRESCKCEPIILYADQDNVIPLTLLDQFGNPVPLTEASGFLNVTAYFPTPDGNLSIDYEVDEDITLVNTEAGQISILVSQANMALLNLQKNVRQDWKVVVSRNVAPLTQAALFPRGVVLQPELVPG